MLKDMISHVKNELLFCKTVSATETPTNGVDLQGFTSATVVCSIGTITNISNSPTPSWTFKLQESDNDSSYSDVAEADCLVTYGSNDGSVTSGVFATVDAADKDDANYTIGYIGTKRYVRVVATAADTPGNTPIAVNVIKESMQRPQDD